ncbi:MAG: type II secretion system protein GspN [Cystobacterineae bacterium]|nr:type II secretion system protein GspN [Cystobacterineae bacterium]
MLKKYSQTVFKLIGYLSFTTCAFLISLFFVFPYPILSEYLVAKAKQANILLSIHSIQPSLSGIKANGIQISPASLKPEIELGKLHMDSLSLRPSLFSSKLITNIKIAKGNIQLATGIFNAKEMSIDAKGIDLSQINFSALLWMLSPEIYNSGTATPQLDMEGVLTHAHISFSIPKNQKASEAHGQWNMELNEWVLKQGTLALLLPNSKEPTPVDLPRIVFGNLKTSASIKKGHIQLSQLKTQSHELESEVLGNIHLDKNKKLADSQSNFTLRLQAQPELLERLGILGSAVSLLPVDPQNPQWRSAQFQGPLSRLEMK